MAGKADHKFKGAGPFCVRCDRLSSRHKERGIRVRTVYNRAYYTTRDKVLAQDRIIGIDGEGVGRKPHRYIYLAASDEFGKQWSVEPTNAFVQQTGRIGPRIGPQQRLTTEQCLDFILALPTRTLIVGFAFLYDLTKILQDLPDKALYLLFREKLRARKRDGRIIYRPIRWRGYRINFMNRRFTVQKGKRRATVWDVFRFFQTKFTSALIDWQVADKEKLEHMASMKDMRAKFDKLSRKEIHAYCKEECTYLAKLARGLIDAHKNAGIKLKTYFGAGSTATALLKSWKVQDKRGETPSAMREPLAQSFFGGRFENSIVGPVARHVYEYDISSAYPYQATLLPCLLHGTWVHVRAKSGIDRKIDSTALALIRWTSKPYGEAWGALPIRSRGIKIDGEILHGGSIAFPLGALGGWTWKEEFFAARAINPTIEPLEAWTYETDCDCGSPFSDLPRIYNERLSLGSDTRGYPLKLGSNSVYGKTVQSAGFNPPFRNWVWGSNITSGCRAQLLKAITSAKDSWSILALATDGVQSLEPLRLPQPMDTGTNATGKPLGGWTLKEYPDGVFYVRPGIYFPLKPTEDEIKIVRARGIGKKVLYDQRHEILKAWKQGGSYNAKGEFQEDVVTFKSVSRFVGAKSGISLGPKSGIKRSENYGDWIDHTIAVSFNSLPKRVERNFDNSLRCHRYFNWESEPYKHAMVDPELAELLVSEMMTEEQPDLDFETVR